MTIKVTQEHIRTGAKGSPGCCPIAKAVREALPGKAVSVIAVIKVYSGGFLKFWAPLTESVRTFIDAFDEGLPVEPFSFELEPAEEIERCPQQNCETDE